MMNRNTDAQSSLPYLVYKLLQCLVPIPHTYSGICRGWPIVLESFPVLSDPFFKMHC